MGLGVGKASSAPVVVVAAVGILEYADENTVGKVYTGTDGMAIVAVGAVAASNDHTMASSAHVSVYMTCADLISPSH